ncbi:hypothetical protein [Elizabethkingia anophelis]|uniref:hypothetical protein n=1 Tax=Elizabethkingia anophelis TaxID=1117645 RepID=UPI002010AF96|nr:hypothetical protein [Elizabethkingia anophelis]MCL1031939.1 hypothetical protein [Elizabethkingia anophelis]
MNTPIKLKTFLLRCILILIVFVICTALSYHNGMAYDGDDTIGFPFNFYKKSVGYSLITQTMQESESFYPWYLFFNFLFTVVLAIALEKLFYFIIKKKTGKTTK